jgi:mRNA interferase RelE/StbE
LAWLIKFAPQTEKDFKRIHAAESKRIFKFLRERIAMLEDPRSIGEVLHGKELGRFWKYRVGDYRLICDIRDEELVILVVRVGHRRDIYKKK